MSQPKPGDRFSFIYLDEEAATPHQAVVHRLLSNREEGLSSPEADFYVAEWLEALPLDSWNSLDSANASDFPPPGPASPDRIQPFTMMLSADCKTTIDGRPVSVTFE